MVIEVGPCNRQYALDTVNVILCDLKLEEDPNFKVKNYRLRWLLYSIGCVVLFVVTMLLTVYYASWILGICTAVFVFSLARSTGYIIATGRIMNQLMGNDHKNTFTFTAEKVVCDTNDMKSVAFRWEYFRYIKIYGSGIYFIPKKKSNPIMAVPISYGEDVRSFLAENNIGLDLFV